MQPSRVIPLRQARENFATETCTKPKAKGGWEFPTAWKGGLIFDQSGL
jgi:hypothetical protein